MTFTLGEERDQNIGARDLAAPGRLYVHGSAMKRSLKACGRLGFDETIHHEPCKLMVNEVLDLIANAFDIDTAGTHDGNCIVIFGQCEQEMLKRGVLVLTLVCQGKGVTERLF
jgi:hypothetical protein